MLTKTLNNSKTRVQLIDNPAKARIWASELISGRWISDKVWIGDVRSIIYLWNGVFLWLNGLLLRRVVIKMVKCCLLCALSSSNSSLAPAVLRRPLPGRPWGIATSKVSLSGGRVSMIHGVVYQPLLQAIHIKVAAFCASAAEDWDALSLTFRELDLGVSGCELAAEAMPLLKVELVGFELVAMEKDDSFCCWVVDAHYLRCLHFHGSTSLMLSLSCRTNFSKWYFLCCEILLYRIGYPYMLNNCENVRVEVMNLTYQLKSQ